MEERERMSNKKATAGRTPRSFERTREALLREGGLCRGCLERPEACEPGCNTPAALAELDEAERECWSAWLIEHGKQDKHDRPCYARFFEGGVEWTDDPLKACHFVRREDAEQLAYGEDCWRITEHEFVGPTELEATP